MSRFKAKSVYVLKRETPTSKWWTLRKGNIGAPLFGFYRAWITCYRAMQDPAGEIVKIQIEVTREKYVVLKRKPRSERRRRKQTEAKNIIKI